MNPYIEEVRNITKALHDLFLNPFQPQALLQVEQGAPFSGRLRRVKEVHGVLQIEGYSLMHN